MNAWNDKGKRGATWFLAALSIFALLIWARQRLVSGVPRTALAVPEQAAQPKPEPDLKPADPAQGAPKQ